jgi:hypothetical protein
MHGFREGHISYLLKSGSILTGHYWSQYHTYGGWDIWIEGEGYLLLLRYSPFE